MVNLNKPSKLVIQIKISFSTASRNLLLLEESTIKELPTYVENVLSNFYKKNSSQAELLFALTYCIALESGFYPSHIYEDRKINKILQVSDLYSYNHMNVTKISQRGFPSLTIGVDEDFYQIELKCCTHCTDKDATKCILNGIKSSDFLIITMTPGSLIGRSVCLPLSRYILSSKKKDLSFRFRNLQEFSILLKGEIFTPLRNELN